MKSQSPECAQLGRRVRDLRKARGLSQDNFALDSDIHRTYIGGIERGERNPTLTMIYRIALALHVDVVELFKAPKK